MLLWSDLSRLFVKNRRMEPGFLLKDTFLPSFSGFHACCECKKTYRSRMALNRHVREECGRVLYTCPFCHSIMPMKFNLLNHLKKEHGCVAKIWREAGPRTIVLSFTDLPWKTRSITTILDRWLSRKVQKKKKKNSKTRETIRKVCIAATSRFMTTTNQ